MAGSTRLLNVATPFGVLLCTLLASAVASAQQVGSLEVSKEDSSAVGAATQHALASGFNNGSGRRLTAKHKVVKKPKKKAAVYTIVWEYPSQGGQINLGRKVVKKLTFKGPDRITVRAGSKLSFHAGFSHGVVLLTGTKSCSDVDNFKYKELLPLNFDGPKRKVLNYTLKKKGTYTFACQGPSHCTSGMWIRVHAI